MGECACIGDALASFRWADGFFKDSKTDEQGGEYLAGFVVKFASDTLALLFLGFNDLAGPLMRCFVKGFKHHIKCACQLVRFGVNACEWSTQGTLPFLHTVHDLAQVYEWTKGNLQHNEIEYDTHQPANGDENDQRHWCCEWLLV